MLRVPYFWGGLILFTLLYFMLTGFDNPVLTIMWSTISGTLIVLLFRLTALGDDGGTRVVGAAIVAASSVVVGTLLKALMTGRVSAVWDSVAVALAVLSAWGFDTLRAWGRHSPCPLCKAAVGRDASFACPRCNRVVCARPSCWSSRHLRCTSCLELEVVLFPTQTDWWARNLGPRVTKGVCDSCFEEGYEADLRACGQCPLLMCRRCWDHHNGRCTRCQWTVGELPPGLRRYIARPAGSGRGPAPRDPRAQLPRASPPRSR